MRFLALDIGTRRTGVAFLDTDTGIPLPLDTIHHSSSEELLKRVDEIAKARSIDRLIIGLPLLLSGEEGSQSGYVRDVAAALGKHGWQIAFVDERYTTDRKGKGSRGDSEKSIEYDRDAAAACALLVSFASHSQIEKK